MSVIIIDRATIADAPACLNTADKAMWVLGFNEARDRFISKQVGPPATPIIGVTAEEKAAILAMPCMCVDHLAGVA